MSEIVSEKSNFIFCGMKWSQTGVYKAVQLLPERLSVIDPRTFYLWKTDISSIRDLFIPQVIKWMQIICQNNGFSHLPVSFFMYFGINFLRSIPTARLQLNVIKILTYCSLMGAFHCPLWTFLRRGLHDQSSTRLTTERLGNLPIWWHEN